MKQTKYVALLLALLLVSIGLISSCSPKGTANKVTTPATDVQTYGAKSAFADDSLTIDKMLQYALQDEYLARSQYESFIEAFENKPPFSNIMNAEVYHISELQKLFKSHTLDITEDFSKDYLVKADDYEKALQIAIDLELENVDMYQKFLDTNLPDDIFSTFSMLRSDSIMHTEEFKKYKTGK